jgi:hypothetical protein
MSRYDGSEPASVTTVLRYLRENYTMPDDTVIGDVQGLMLMRDQADEMEKAVKVFGSHAYYVGDKIAVAHDLKELPPEDDGEEGPDW